MSTAPVEEMVDDVCLEYLDPLPVRHLLGVPLNLTFMAIRSLNLTYMAIRSLNLTFIMAIRFQKNGIARKLTFFSMFANPNFL